MKIVTADQMAAIDRYAIDTMGIPGEQLMEAAGKTVARIAHRYTGKIFKPRNMLFFVGKGNNGGDALVAARYLLREHPDINISVVVLASPDSLSGDALENYRKLAQLAPDVFIHAETLEQLLEVKPLGQKAHLIIDGIFGTGFRGAPHGHMGEAIFFINSLHKPVLSIDIPSGLNGSTGKVEKMAVKASLTVTFGLPKTGLLLLDGPAYAGRISVVDIGFPDAAVASVESKLHYLEWKHLRSKLPLRPVDSHKGTFGHLLVLAGSVGLTGAAMLASNAAMRAGCGMVTLGCPESVNVICETNLIEVITAPLPETDAHTLDLTASEHIFDIIRKRKCSALLIGPGLGRHERTTQLVGDIIKHSSLPLIIDADALNSLSDSSPHVLLRAAQPVIITPHPAELSRLLGVTVADIQADRLKYSMQCATQYGVITILKGCNTIIATPESDIYINPTGNTGLATAGTGDVLAGLIGSFLVQGMDPVDAACTAVYVHGKAADLVGHFIGARSLIASDLIKYLPDALR